MNGENNQATNSVNNDLPVIGRPIESTQKSGRMSMKFIVFLILGVVLVVTLLAVALNFEKISSLVKNSNSSNSQQPIAQKLPEVPIVVSNPVSVPLSYPMSSSVRR